jgi:hypothetical protein
MHTTWSYFLAFFDPCHFRNGWSRLIIHYHNIIFIGIDNLTRAMLRSTAVARSLSRVAIF